MMGIFLNIVFLAELLLPFPILDELPLNLVNIDGFGGNKYQKEASFFEKAVNVSNCRVYVIKPM